MSNNWKELVAEDAETGVTPLWQGNVPLCSDWCAHQQKDGETKRCAVNFGNPQLLCTPTVIAMGKQLSQDINLIQLLKRKLGL